MLRKRFFISWFLSVIVMMAISWVWHGLILNDLIYVPRPVLLFYALALLAYIIIGFTLTFVYTYLSMGLGIKLKGMLMGMALGFFIYLIAFVFGISFKGNGTEHVVLDFIWQMIEQGAGGAVIAVVYYLAHNNDLAMDRVRN
jgi:hypothetical protein